MKAVLLCNGPSRVSYTPSLDYKFVMGCNVPWTDVDATTIVDGEMINKWSEKRDIIKVPVYYSIQAWQLAKQIDEEFFRKMYAGTVKVENYYHSSGHSAAEQLIAMGYNDIDVFGCDAYFKNTAATSASSSTDAFVPREKGPNWELRMHDKMIGWKVRWDVMRNNNPHVKLNFIR